MGILKEEELRTMPIKELQIIVYELGIDEALDIGDRNELIDLYYDYIKCK
jgi:hypothetical protein